MSTAENKALVLRIYEAHNKGKETMMPVIEELFAPDYVVHSGAVPDIDWAGFKKVGAEWWTIFPDIHYTVEDLIAVEDKVVSRVTFRATHKGEFMGVPATGKVVTVTAIAIDRIAGGKIAETWGEQDMLGLLQQLGAIP